jgi:phosphoglycolate phosphatase
MTDFRLLVFDWDGTLMDSAARIVSCMQSAMRDVGMPPLAGDRIRNIIGLGLEQALNALVPDLSLDQLAALAMRYRHHFLVADPTPSRLFPGAAEALERLSQKGYLMAVATGKGRRGLNKALAETGLAKHFHCTRCADETASKPSPAMLLEIMAELEVAPEHTLVIGDTEYDLLMARYAGAYALAVGYGVHERERLLSLGPLGCLDSIDDLESVLKLYSKCSSIKPN